MGKMFEDVRFEPTEESNMLFLAAGWPTGASEEERLFGVPTDCKVQRLFTNIVVFCTLCFFWIVQIPAARNKIRLFVVYEICHLA